MSEMAEIFKCMQRGGQAKRQAREEFYSPIIESLGGVKFNDCSYRLGEYNVYTSKGWVLPKSNKGERIPLQTFLKDYYNYEVDGKELSNRIKQAIKEADKDFE